MPSNVHPRRDIGGALCLAAMFAVILIAAACKQKPPADQPSRTPPRTDFSPEEFGVGRAHTKNAACNQEIDLMLNEARRCYNSRPAAECDAQQRLDAEKTAQLKNSRRCSR